MALMFDCTLNVALFLQERIEVKVLHLFATGTKPIFAIPG